MEDQTNSDAPATADRGGKAGKKRKRRGLRILLWSLLGLLVLLVALVALAPTLLSTGPGERLVAGQVSRRLNGELRIGDLDVSWFGDTELRNVTLYDAQQREVLAADRAHLGRGIWGLLFDRSQLGRITVERPRIVLYEMTDGGFSLTRVVPESQQPAQPPVEEPAGPPAWQQYQAHLVVSDGELLIVRLDDQRFRAHDIQVDERMDGLDRIAGSITAQGADGSLRLENDLRNLAAGGELSLDAAEGTVALATGDGGLRVEPLAVVIGMLTSEPLTRSQGTLGIDGTATLSPGQLSASFELLAQEVLLAREGDQQLAPLSVRLAATGGIEDDVLQAEVGLRDVGVPQRLGSLVASVWADLTTFDALPDGAALLSAVMTGENVDLPQLRVTAQGQLDLPALAQSVPALLKLREQVSVQSGTLAINDVRIDTVGEAPVARGSVLLSQIQATVQDRPVEIQPVRLAFDAVLPENAPLALESFLLEAESINLTAQSLEGGGLGAKFAANLEPLYDRFAQVVDIPELELGGQATGSLALTRPEENRLALAAEVDARGVRFVPPDAQSGDTLVFEQGRLAVGGSLLLNEQRRPARAQVDEATLTLPQLAARLEGWYALDGGREGAFEGAVTLDADRLRRAIEPLRDESPMLAALGSAIANVRGQATWQSTVDLSPSATQIRVDQLEAQVVLPGEQGAPPTPVTATAAVTLAGPIVSGSISAQTGSIRGTAADVAPAAAQEEIAATFTLDIDSLEEVNWNELLPALLFGQPVQLPRGVVEVNGTLARRLLMTLLSAANVLPEGTEVVQADVVLRLAADTDRPEAGSQGQVEIRALQIRRNGQVEAVDPVTLVFDLRRPPGEPLRIDAARLDSALAQVRAEGTMLNLRSRVVVPDLAVLQDRVNALTGALPEPLSGSVDATLQIERVEPQVLAYGLSARTENLVVGLPPPEGGAPGGQVVLASSSVRSDGSLLLDERRRPTRLIADSVEVFTPLAQVTGSARYDLEAALATQFTGSVRVDDLAELARVLVAAGGGEAGEGAPPVAGSLVYDFVGQHVPDGLVVKGEATASNLLIGKGEEAFRTPQVQWSHDVALDLTGDVAVIRDFQVRSDVLNGHAEGFVRELSTNQVLDLRASLQSEGQALANLLHEIAPSTAELDFAGPQVELVATGPIASPAIVPAALSGRGQVQLASASAMGLRAAAFDLNAQLRDGVVNIAQTAIPVNNGTMTVAGQVDLPTGGAMSGTATNGATPSSMPPTDPVYRYAGRLQVFDHVEINEEMSNELISYINPVFFGVERITGSVSLVVEDVQIPLSEAAIQQGYIRHGRLDFHDLQMEPTPLLKAILTVVGAPGQMLGGLGEMEIPGVEFRMENGRIYYDDFIIRFRNVVHLRFRGYVGLNDELQLWVGVPATPEVLANIGNALNLPQLPRFSAQVLPFLQLNDNYLEVAVVGTRTLPQVRWEALGETLQTQLQSVVRGLLQGGVDIGEGARQILEDVNPIQPGGPGIRLPGDIRPPQIPGTAPAEPPTQPARPRNPLQGLFRRGLQ